MVQERLRKQQADSRRTVDGDRADSSRGKVDGERNRWRFQADWRTSHKVPSRFRPSMGQDSDKGLDSYTDYAGLRFPSLDTSEHYNYHKDKGLRRIQERALPIKVPGHRRLNPYLREYIHFLHALDPARFTIDRIAERYRLRAKTVEKVVSEWGRNLYLTRSGLTRISEKQVTKEEVVLRKKEEQYAKWVGWDELGDADDAESDDEALGDFRGFRTTSDWVRRTTVEVEMMSAFPMSEKRDPMPKRVDVDVTVDTKRNHKIINWIDPTDKVVF